MARETRMTASLEREPYYSLLEIILINNFLATDYTGNKTGFPLFFHVKIGRANWFQPLWRTAFPVVQQFLKKQSTS